MHIPSREQAALVQQHLHARTEVLSMQELLYFRGWACIRKDVDGARHSLATFYQRNMSSVLVSTVMAYYGMQG